MKKLLIIITCLASLILAGCSERFHIVHKIDVQQGNVVTQDRVDQLEPGMTRNQVQYIMGSPIVVDVFHQGRWDYLYVKRNGPDVLNESKITVVFEGDNLSAVTGDYLPPAWDTRAPEEIQADEAAAGGEEATEETVEES